MSDARRRVDIELSSEQLSARSVSCNVVDRKESAMQIRRSGTQASGKGPAECFTGAVRIDPLFEAPSPARVSASPNTSMTHIAIVEALDGKTVNWMEKVTDQQYQAAAQSAQEQRWSH
jgi:hypothetical protein